MYILDLSLTLTFDLYVDGRRYLSEFYSQFLSFLIQVHVPVILFCYDILTSIFVCNLTVLLFCVARLASKSMISKGSRSMKQKEDKVSFFEESRALSDVVQKLHRQKVGEAHFCRFCSIMVLNVHLPHDCPFKSLQNTHYKWVLDQMNLWRVLLETLFCLRFQWNCSLHVLKIQIIGNAHVLHYHKNQFKNVYVIDMY